MGVVVCGCGSVKVSIVVGEVAVGKSLERWACCCAGGVFTCKILLRLIIRHVFAGSILDLFHVRVAWGGAQNGYIMCRRLLVAVMMAVLFYNAQLQIWYKQLVRVYVVRVYVCVG